MGVGISDYIGNYFCYLFMFLISGVTAFITMFVIFQLATSDHVDQTWQWVLCAAVGVLVGFSILYCCSGHYSDYGGGLGSPTQTERTPTVHRHSRKIHSIKV